MLGSNPVGLLSLTVRCSNHSARSHLLRLDLTRLTNFMCCYANLQLLSLRLRKPLRLRGSRMSLYGSIVSFQSYRLFTLMQIRIRLLILMRIRNRLFSLMWIQIHLLKWWGSMWIRIRNTAKKSRFLPPKDSYTYNVLFFVHNACTLYVSCCNLPYHMYSQRYHLLPQIG